ncbi:MAG: hypothetical protein ACK5O2_16230 [Microthrixaceae bacterium]
MNTRHMTSKVALVALALSAAIACAPPPQPPAPSVTASIGWTADGSSTPGIVEFRGVATNFPGSGNYDVAWTITDARTGDVVHAKPDAIGNVDGNLALVIEPGLFSAEVNGTQATIEVAVSVTATRGAKSATGTATASLTWDIPSDPITGSLVIDQNPTYTVAQYAKSVCTPVGTTVTFTLTGELTGAAVDLATWSDNYSNLTQVDQGTGTAQITTTTECWAPGVLRLDFTGQMTGTTGYTITW